MPEGLLNSPLLQAIAGKPRFRLGTFPTPLEEAHTLSDRLGIRLLVKRDDQTGLALGGNKVRKLEFLIGDALERGADTVVTTGGSQSNHARLTAAACRRAGLTCHLVLDRGLHPEAQGNLLLDELLGAQIHFLESSEPAAALDAMHDLARELENGGRSPYIIPRGGSVAAGATGYAAMAVELQQQLGEAGVKPDYLYLCTGSCGTHAGTLVGFVEVGAPIIVQGISVSRKSEAQRATVLALAGKTLTHLGLPAMVCDEDVRVDDRCVGPGYGIVTQEALEAITLAARDEAIILDPVYTAKTLAGLIGHARNGELAPGATVVFLHTGGTPALFAYHQEIVSSLRETRT
jgi:D-cysteine desulfhydrase family pyridoxal phosphate-dependent enzyme